MRPQRETARQLVRAWWLADRGFCSFAHLAMLAAGGVMGLFRMHQKQIVDFRPHRGTRRDAENRYISRF